MIVVMSLTGLMQYHHHDVFGHIFIHLSVCHEYDNAHSDAQSAHHSHDEDCPMHLKECTEGKILASALAENIYSDALPADIICISKSDSFASCSCIIDCNCAICSTFAVCTVLRAPPVIV